jgi:UDP-2,3-diacylglucosamine hydrolase
MAQTLPPGQPSTRALFIADLHLQAGQPRTLAAFFTFLQQHASKTGALYILGDLFEYWAGDDDIPDPCNHSIVKALRTLVQSGVPVFWLAGNRDFLLGSVFAKATGATLLAEPHVLPFDEVPGAAAVCLSHGDAECLDDTGYMTFRARVRNPAWQSQFLAMPLSQRKALIEGMRQGSREQQRSKSAEIMDVNAGAISRLFDSTGTRLMIHGHTHRPAIHRGLDGRVRHVLSDWDCDSEAQRGGFIALDLDGELRHYTLHGLPVAL